jgi:two-component system CheB/CheR fusion protein
MEKEDYGLNNSERAIEVNERSSQKSFFPIVALGGSAGSFKAFEKFLSQTPPDTGFAFVIIMHLDPRKNMNVAGILQKCTLIPVIEAEDGTQLAPNHAYIIPPNKDMGIHNGTLLLFKASRTKRCTYVDRLLLAEFSGRSMELCGCSNLLWNGR